MRKGKCVEERGENKMKGREKKVGERCAREMKSEKRGRKSN